MKFNAQMYRCTRLSCRGSVELNKYTFLSSFASCSLNYQKILITLQIMISLGPFIDDRQVHYRKITEIYEDNLFRCDCH